jgi:hypothetical protein
VAEDARDRSPSVQPDRLSGRASQVRCQCSEFAESPRLVCALYPLNVLGRRQPSVGCGLAEQRDNPVAFEVGGTKISRCRAITHSLKILQPQVTDALPRSRRRFRAGWPTLDRARYLASDPGLDQAQVSP